MTISERIEGTEKYLIASVTKKVYDASAAYQEQMLTRVLLEENETSYTIFTEDKNGLSIGPRPKPHN